MGTGMVGFVVRLGFFFGGGFVISGVVKRLCNGSEGASLDDLRGEGRVGMLVCRYVGEGGRSVGW